MSVNFTGRVAVVTGAGNGLGASYARRLAHLGAAVVVNDLGSSVDGAPDGTRPADLIVEEIVAAGGRAVANNDNVASPEGGRAIVDTAVQAFGRLDIVVNNAGNRRNAPLLEITPEDFEAVLAVHLKGALYVSQPAFEVMKDQGYGRLLFTGSSAGMFGNAGQATYAAAKAGVFGLSQAVAIEGEPYGVTANVLLPMASTQRALAGTTEQAFDAMQVDPDRHTLDPDQVSSLVAYLVSEECKLTHQVFGSAAGRCYSAFVATTAGWRHTGPGIATADAVAANVDMILDRTGYQVPDSLRADISDSMQPPTPAERVDPRNVVGAYFAAVLNKDTAALRQLFTQSAHFDVPGTTLSGNDAVAKFYAAVFENSTPRPSPGPLIVRDNTVAVQIALHHQGRDARIADFFEITDDGRIGRLTAYQAD